MEHRLKTDADVFQAMVECRKTYELRKDDRGFQVGDTLTLCETRYTGQEMISYEHPDHPGRIVDGKPLEYTGRTMGCVVTHILRGPIYGLAEGWAILSCK